MTTVPGTNFTKEQLEADIEGNDYFYLLHSHCKQAIELTYIVDNVSDGGYSGSHKLNRFGVVYHYEKQKYDKALAWYILAARENNPRAQNNIGTLYRDELGVPKNYLCALKWFLKAAQLGDNPNIFNNVGNLFERGYGVPFDRYKALEWYCHGGVKYRDKLKSQGYHRSTADKSKLNSISDSFY
jgi:tetratricopeptide (TPR) repeat protein